MDDFERITVGEARNAVSFTGDNLPIAFDDHARRPNFQLLEERGDSKSVSDFAFLTVNFQFHSNKKNRIRGSLAELPGNTVSSLSRSGQDGTATFTLPYAGATRIRFKGLPELIRLSVCLRQTPLASLAPLTKRYGQVNKVIRCRSNGFDRLRC
jgi:hypothetical protein